MLPVISRLRVEESRRHLPTRSSSSAPVFPRSLFFPRFRFVRKSFYVYMHALCLCVYLLFFFSLLLIARTSTYPPVITLGNVNNMYLVASAFFLLHINYSSLNYSSPWSIYKKEKKRVVSFARKRLEMWNYGASLNLCVDLVARASLSLSLSIESTL